MALNMRRLQHIIAQERVDLVHVRSRWAAWTAVKACRKAKRPLVTSLPVDGVRTRPRSSFETAVAEGDIVIASSEFVAGRAETLFPAPPKRLRIVRAGMDLSKLQPERVSGRRVSDVRSSWGVAAHERVVLMPARLAPGRGQQTLIEAAALIKSQGLDDVRFVLAGEAAKPVFARELDALAIKCGVQSMIIRVGAAADPPAAFIGAAIVVFPATEVDGVTRTSIEAAAIGALTIISDIGSAREIVAAPPHADAEAAHRMARSAPRAGRACRGDPRCAFARRLRARGRAAPVAGEDRRSLFARTHDARHAQHLRRGAGATMETTRVAAGRSGRRRALRLLHGISARAHLGDTVNQRNAAQGHVVGKVAAHEREMFPGLVARAGAVLERERRSRALRTQNSRRLGR